MGRLLVPLFASTLFLTSALLFVLEPLVAKGLLPVLGGGAAVWTTSVAFFQLALLAGYLYAHLAPSWLPPRRHAVVHVALLAAAAIALPLRAPAGLVAPASHQAIWLFGRLAASIGPAFVLLAATAPLVQRWLASTGHRDARDPYFLYVASNAGSLLALAAYPVLLEPLAGLERQRRLWMGGLALAIVLLAASAAAAWRAGLGRNESAADAGARAADPPVPGSLRLRWLVLAAVPSSLLLSVTGYLTTDIVAMPLLWVVPLALYLLTFILAFSRRTFVSPRRAVWLQALLLVPIAAEMFMRTEASAIVLVPLHAAAFFVTALVCHQALAASRPSGARSTEFYLYVAAGGALGGLFNVFAAPLLFKSLLEYPIGLIVATLLRPRPDNAPGAGSARDARRRDLALPLALAVLLLAGVRAAHAIETRAGATGGLAALVVLVTAAALATYSFRGRPLRFGLALAAIMASGATYAKGATRTLYAARSFYGTHKVLQEPPETRLLAHGNTTHGAQDLAARRREPLTYYHRTGPIGGVMAAWQGRPQRRRVGLVGLGAGSLAAYAEPGERWTFFEIDPAVIDIARDRGWFTFLADTRGAVDVVAGDGRLSLAAVPDGTFGMIVLDAFSSDAVPAHLLTREAFALALRKLTPDGIIAVHISNRYLDLESVAAGSARALGLSTLVRFDPTTAEDERAFKQASHWMLLARTAGDLAPVAADPRWHAPGPAGAGWTDDASNVWGALHIFGR